MATDGKKCEVESCPHVTWRDDTRCLFHSTDIEGKKDEIEETLADLTGANLEFAFYLEAARLLEVRSLKGVRNLNLTRLPDYPSLTEEEKEKLHRLCR